MRQLGAFSWKVWFDKKTGRPIGYDTRTACVNCPIRKKYGESIEQCPPSVTTLPVADLDRPLPSLIGKTSDIIEAQMDTIMFEGSLLSAGKKPKKE